MSKINKYLLLIICGIVLIYQGLFVKIIGMLIAIFSPMYYMKFFDKLDNYPIFSGILLGLIMLIQASLFVFAYNYFFLFSLKIEIGRAHV